MSTPLRLATALLVPWLLLAGCGDDEPESSEPSSEPSSELSSEATDESTSETSETSEPTESATATSTEEPTDTPTLGPSETPGEGDDCFLLPLAAVTAAFGEEMVLIGAGAQTCIFNSAAGSANALTVNLAQLQVDQDEYAEGTRDGCDGKISEVRAGDQAFACQGPIGPQGYLFQGDHSVVLDVAFGGPQASVKLATKLLGSVTVP